MTIRLPGAPSASGMGLATIERAAELGFLPVGFDVADQRPDGRPASEAGSDRLRRRHRPSAVKNAVHEIERTVGSIALAVRAAGVLTEKPFASVDEELWNKTLEVHPRGQRAPQGRLPDTLPAFGLDSVSGAVSIVQATLDSIPGDKILVGHSSGGFVITNAAIGRSDVRGLVYTAAYVPDTGETINSLSVGYTQGAFLAHLLFAPSFPFVIVDPQFFPRTPHALQDTLREPDRTSGSLDRNLIPARWPPSPSRFGRVPTAEGDSRPWGRRSRWRALSEPAVYAD